VSVAGRCYLAKKEERVALLYFVREGTVARRPQGRCRGWPWLMTLRQ
jgi:hypothetical protein